MRILSASGLSSEMSVELRRPMTSSSCKYMSNLIIWQLLACGHPGEFQVEKTFRIIGILGLFIANQMRRSAYTLLADSVKQGNLKDAPREAKDLAFRRTCSFPSTVISVPAYFEYTTLSPACKIKLTHTWGSNFFSCSQRMPSWFGNKGARQYTKTNLLIWNKCLL